MKNKIIIASLLMASVLCLASCGEKKSDTETGSDTASVEAVIPEKDADGNKIEIVEVTDAQGEVVKDENDKPVTELEIVDEKGEVITEANGEKAKPNIPAQIASKSPSGNSSNNNSNNNNNNSSSNNSSNSSGGSNNSSAGGNSSSNNSSSASDHDAETAAKTVSFLWLGPQETRDGDVIFKGITSDTDVMEITFKVKEGAKNGKYEIKMYSDPSCSSTFCNQAVQSLDIEYCTGTIGVNEDVSETKPGSGLSFVIGSGSAKPGETVTIKCSVRNIPEEIIAFNSFLSYDDSVLEPVSAVGLGVVGSTGDFTTNVN